MAPLSLACPLCCNETFSSHISLKYHLLSMIDNLLCPSCNERCDDLMDMADHLGRECKNLKQSSSDQPVDEPVVSQETKTEECLEETEEVTETHKEPKIRFEVLDTSSENNQTGNKIIDIDEKGNVNDKPSEKLSEDHHEETESMYTCQMCNVTFSSVQDHLAKYHEGEEVLVETEQDENGDSQGEELSVMEYRIGTTDDDVDNDEDQFEDEENIVENSENIADVAERDGSSMDQTISEQEMVDTTGMGYTRKIVKMGINWITNSQEESDSQKLPEDNEEIEPDTTKYIVQEGKVRKITEEEAAAIADKSSIIEVHKCPYCELQFPNMSHFKKHSCKNAKPIINKRHKKNQLIKIKEELRYQCTFCLAIYCTLIGLNDHMKSHLIKDESGIVQKKTITMTLHVCDICNTKFPTYKQLRLHSRMHEPIKNKEVDPPVAYNIMGQTNEENEDSTNTEREMFQCHICDKIYDKEYEDVHMKSHEEQENNVCLVCNRKFDTRENLEMHMKAHSNTKKFACSYCKKPFNTYPALEEHVLNQCQKGQYECQYCGRRFSRPHEKVKHERIHTGEKPHVCQICGRAFRVSYCLTLHMRTHTNTRPYTCRHCGKRFKSNSAYNHHMMTHSDERNFKCQFCPKAFKTAVQLAGHENSHTKPFSCTECNRPFASLYAVRTHMETHKRDNNLKFDCWICGASYARSFALRDHMNSAHGESTEKAADDNGVVTLENQPNEGMEPAEHETEEHQPEGEENQMMVEEEEYHIADAEGEDQVLGTHEERGSEGYVVHLQEVEHSEHAVESQMEVIES